MSWRFGDGDYGETSRSPICLPERHEELRHPGLVRGEVYGLKPDRLPAISCSSGDRRTRVRRAACGADISACA